MINSKLSLFGRYNYSPSSIDQRGPYFGTPQVLSDTELTSFSIQTLTIGLTEIINQDVSNEIRANYSNGRVGNKFGLDNFGGAMPLPDPLLSPPGFSSANGLFAFEIIGAGEFVKGKLSTDEQRQVNLVDNLSVTRGDHQLKFGVDFRWLSPFANRFAYRQFVEF